MKRVIVTVFGLLWSLAVLAASEQVVEIPVQGMTCPFCVYGVEKNLGKLPGVAQVRVSLQQKKARIVMQPGERADVDRIKQTILEAGFTPGEVNVQTLEQ